MIIKPFGVFIFKKLNNVFPLGVTSCFFSVTL